MPKHISKSEFNPVPKPSHKRIKKTAKERGSISADVYSAILERDNECCARCYSGHNLQAAHLVRRWKLQLTTIHDVCMLCMNCHNWADTTADGRKWLEAKREELMKGSVENDQIKNGD